MSSALVSLRRKAVSYLRLPIASKVGVIVVFLLLGIARLAILVVPFKIIARLLGVKSGIVPWVPLLAQDDERRALSLRRLISLVSNHTPWESNCYSQAIVARILLGLLGIPYALFFGLARDSRANNQISAHAWVVAGKVTVSGGESFAQFTVVGCFLSPKAVDSYPS